MQVEQIQAKNSSNKIIAIADVVFLISLCLIAFGLAFSNLLMTWGQFGFGIAVFGGLDYKNKWKNVIRNPAALIWTGLYILYLVSGLNSENTDYYLKDIRTKIPLFAMPIAMAAMGGISTKKYAIVLHVFILSLFVYAGYGLSLYSGVFGDNLADSRGYSPLVSHIRMGLFLVMALFIIYWLLNKNQVDSRLFPKAFYIIILTVLIGYLIVLKPFTAVPVFIAAFVALVLRYLFRKKSVKVKILWILFLVISLAGIGIYLGVTIKEFYNKDTIDIKHLPIKTAEGNLYENLLEKSETENGHWVYLHLCSQELEREWVKRSKIPYFGHDHKGNLLSATLIRYMTSLNLTKDAEGMKKMTEKDVQNVENGYANYLYAKTFSLRGRIFEILWELNLYSSDANPNGRSMAMRLELWKASAKVIALNPFGVGTGDVRDALKTGLRSMESKLRYEKDFGPHNQYLATTLALGFPGLFWLLLALFYPLFKSKNKIGFLFTVFLAIALVSFLNEDMFETQAAVTFLTFWYSFFLFGEKRDLENQSSSL